MIGVFKQKSPGNLIMVFLVGMLLKLPLFFSDHPVVIRKQDGFMFDRFIEFLTPISQFFPGVFAFSAFLIIFWQAYLLTNFINKHRLVNRSNYLPGLTFVLLTSFLPEFSYLSAPLMVSLLFLLSFVFLYRSVHQNSGRGYVFNSGLMLGLATMFFQPAIFFIIWALIAIILLRPFRLNEWLLLLLGAATPYYFQLTYLFLNDQWHLVSGIIEPFSFGINKEPQSLWFAGALFLTILPLLAGVYYVHTHSGKMLMQVKKGWILFLLYFGFSVVIAFVNPGPSYTNWIIILVPCAAFHAYGYLHSELKLFPIISFWLTVVFIALSQLLGKPW